MTDQDQLTLTWQKFIDQKVISPFVLKHMVLNVFPTLEMYESMGIRMEASILGRDLPDICYPRDWWQSIKERWFPQWALRRWPVSRIIHKIKEMYPDAEVKGLGTRYATETGVRWT